MFATNAGDVTLIGPDDQVWQGARPAGTLKLVSSQASSYKDAAEPSIPAREHHGEYALGSNQQLFESVKIGEGMYRWQKVENRLADNTNGFILPSGRQEVARLDPAAIDSDGVILRIFVGFLACYKRADALPVFWDGFDMFDVDGRYLHVPEKFKRGIPSTMGLEGIIYIPQEFWLEDLLISLEEQELSYPDPYHKSEEFDKIGARQIDGRHEKTQRKVGNQDARACFESAWDAAVFEVTDVFTMPGATFAERRNMLETFLKPLKDSYKQIRLIPIMPILSQEWAISAYENTPINANLVIIDPESMYEHPVGPKERKDKPRRQFEKKEKASPLVGWKLDGSGKLEAVVVEGNNSQKSAIVVYPGQLWVDVTQCKDMSEYRRKLTVELQRFNIPMRGFGDCKVPMEFISKMKKAYEEDFNTQTRSYNALIAPTFAFKARERAMKNILTTVATRIWNFGTDGYRRTEFAGANVTKQLVQCITAFVLKDVPNRFDLPLNLHNNIAGMLNYLIRTPLVYADDLHGLMKVSMAGGKDATEFVAMYLTNMADPDRQKRVRDVLFQSLQAIKTTSLGKHANVDERLYAIGDICEKAIPDSVFQAFIHTDQDYFATLSRNTMEKSMSVTPPDVPKLYLNSVAKSYQVPLDGVRGTTNLKTVTSDELATFRDVIYAVASVFIQGGHIPGPTFAVPPIPLSKASPPMPGTYTPVGGVDSKNLMAWGSTQIVNYQRAFPYGALIGYKVQKGDDVSWIPEVDLYTMTKVTIV
ncbi:hypothetical protein JKP88DRAFT_251708 [Tribonema minus]|uniref:Uncharacterized protein n=1 Tax=Tribonema minus TaxID=303371 RepID=A0A835ZFR6_9STRA|nr:hypothetical protein JKP88DRAFT_251708 [Tribonema minus]